MGGNGHWNFKFAHGFQWRLAFMLLLFSCNGMLHAQEDDCVPVPCNAICVGQSIYIIARPACADAGMVLLKSGIDGSRLVEVGFDVPRHSFIAEPVRIASLSPSRLLVTYPVLSNAKRYAMGYSILDTNGLVKRQGMIGGHGEVHCIASFSMGDGSCLLLAKRSASHYSKPNYECWTINAAGHIVQLTPDQCGQLMAKANVLRYPEHSLDGAALIPLNGGYRLLREWPNFGGESYTLQDSNGKAVGGRLTSEYEGEWILGAFPASPAGFFLVTWQTKDVGERMILWLVKFGLDSQIASRVRIW